jgi:hypothetical protein
MVTINGNWSMFWKGCWINRASMAKVAFIALIINVTAMLIIYSFFACQGLIQRSGYFLLVNLTYPVLLRECMP